MQQKEYAVSGSINENEFVVRIVRARYRCIAALKFKFATGARDIHVSHSPQIHPPIKKYLYL